MNWVRNWSKPTEDVQHLMENEGQRSSLLHGFTQGLTEGFSSTSLPMDDGKLSASGPHFLFVMWGLCWLALSCWNIFFLMPRYKLQHLMEKNAFKAYLLLENAHIWVWNFQILLHILWECFPMVIFINFKGFTKHVPTVNRVIYQRAIADIKWNKVQTKIHLQSHRRGCSASCPFI